MLCQACRATLPEGAAFCPTCGTRVESGPPPVPVASPPAATTEGPLAVDPTQEIPPVTPAAVAPPVVTPVVPPAPAPQPVPAPPAAQQPAGKQPTTGDTEPIAIREWYPGADVDRDPAHPPQTVGQPADSPMYAVLPRPGQNLGQTPGQPSARPPRQAAGRGVGAGRIARPWPRGDDSVARDGKAALLVIGVATVFLVGLVWLFVSLLSGSAPSGGSAQRSIPAVTGSNAPGSTAGSGGNAAALPDGAKRCAGGTGVYDAVYVSGTTSCPFAQAVRDAYAAAYPNPVDQGTVTARSPVTNKTYAMSCTGTTVITCTGGVEARVYLTVK